MTFLDTAIYALLWLSFGIVHSLLARSSCKTLLAPIFGCSYRLSYNLFAALHIGLVMIIGRLYLGQYSPNFDMPNWFFYLTTTTQLIGIGVILISLREYDLGSFSGLKQLFVASNDEESLHLSGMHRYIRHPLYLGVYLYLIGGMVSDIGLQTALWGGIYLFIGTWFEERSLVKQYGRAYVEYKEKVPAVIPFKGRAIG
jgi:protein-S-isoprenylcysteine O-methyltransferase Ste14